MSMPTANRFLHFLLAPPARLAAAFSIWHARLCAKIDSGAPPLHRRFGAWEAYASLLATAALEREAARRRNAANDLRR
ncbi:MAG TPA: hypothetical protein VEC01_14820 [Noviherbaspirillum sp.]|uniref:hypothetical protein n=1 Tax=Noviherbaspirillum sp. TaxID=1926288 RepID=UPI002D4246EB|nr:hypothetical protein [Noviherbaspirillum sp.]HYD96600.1 hypothetical protein [Noviherbaspirillum sp.]